MTDKESKQLTDAIVGLTAALNKLSQQTDMATKDDLKQAEARIIKAIKAGGISEGEAGKLATQLKGPTDALDTAVKSNQ